jgi:hypothetical protein
MKGLNATIFNIPHILRGDTEKPEGVHIILLPAKDLYEARRALGTSGAATLYDNLAEIQPLIRAAAYIHSRSRLLSDVVERGVEAVQKAIGFMHREVEEAFAYRLKVHALADTDYEGKARCEEVSDKLVKTVAAKAVPLGIQDDGVVVAYAANWIK